MRRGIAWIIMALVVVVILVSGYAIVTALQQSSTSPTPTPTATTEAIAAATATPATLGPTDTPLPSPMPTENIAPPTETPTPAVPTPTPTPSETPYVVPAGAYTVNVRQSPATGDVPVIGFLPPDGSLAIVGTNPAGDWWQVCCVGTDQVRGWVFKEVVQAIGPLENVPLAPEFVTVTPTIAVAETPAVEAGGTISPTSTPTQVPVDETPIVATPLPSAGETATPPVTGTGQIRGLVYWDQNDNNRWDEGEPVLAGALISAYVLPAMDRAGDTMSDANGVFIFDNLPTGRYSLFQTAPIGFQVSPLESMVTVTVEAGQVVEVAFRNAPRE